MGGMVIAVIAIITTSSMGNAGLLASSRFPFAMSRDKLLPSFFGRLHATHFTPVHSITISALIIGLSILLLDIGKIAKLASAFMLIIYMMENVAVIVLRETRVQWYRPTYRTPFYPPTPNLWHNHHLGVTLQHGFYYRTCHPLHIHSWGPIISLVLTEANCTQRCYRYSG